MTIYPASPERPELKLDTLLVRLGFSRTRTELDASTRAMIVEMLETARRLIDPRQAIAETAITGIRAGGIDIDGGPTIQSRDVAHMAAGCARLYGFAVTIGPALEAKRDACIHENQPARALVLDAAGSCAAEELAEKAHRVIAGMAERAGLECTRRFSPGYGDWPVKAQPALLDWIGAGQLGIRLTDAMQMLPEKSVSAVLAARPRISHEPR